LIFQLFYQPERSRDTGRWEGAERRGEKGRREWRGGGEERGEEWRDWRIWRADKMVYQPGSTGKGNREEGKGGREGDRYSGLRE